MSAAGRKSTSLVRIGCALVFVLESRLDLHLEQRTADPIITHGQQLGVDLHAGIEFGASACASLRRR